MLDPCANRKELMPARVSFFSFPYDAQKMSSGITKTTPGGRIYSRKRIRMYLGSTRNKKGVLKNKIDTDALK
jgi:hypothetical protein